MSEGSQQVSDLEGTGKQRRKQCFFLSGAGGLVWEFFPGMDCGRGSAKISPGRDVGRYAELVVVSHFISIEVASKLIRKI